MSSFLVKAAGLGLAVALGTGGVASADPLPTSQVLFDKGMGGYECFRIPALIRAADGSLLAFAEGRKTLPGGSWCADAAPIDTVVRRSTDGGRTWSEPSIVLSGSPDGSADGATRGNPEPILVTSGPDRGRIVLLTTYNPVGGGVRIPFVQHSDDNGLTWSAATSLRPSVDDPSFGWFATGPSHGIELQYGAHAGRLVAGVNYDDQNGLTHGAIIYSDDAGEQWHLGADQIAPVQNHQFGELSVFQQPGGTVTAIARNKVAGDMTQSRLEATSTDGGSTFATGFVAPSGLVGTPGVQGASLAIGHRVLISQPVDPTFRKNMTVFTSNDGTSWQTLKQLTTDRSGYSDLTYIGALTVGVLYEAGDYPTGDARDQIRFDEIDVPNLG